MSGEWTRMLKEAMRRKIDELFPDDRPPEEAAARAIEQADGDINHVTVRGEVTRCSVSAPEGGGTVDGELRLQSGAAIWFESEDPALGRALKRPSGKVVLLISGELVTLVGYKGVTGIKVRYWQVM